MTYRAAVDDFRFMLDHLIDTDALRATERFAEATGDVTDAILTEAGKLCDEVLAPLQRNGDLHPARLENGVVRTSPGYAEGFAAIAEGGDVGFGQRQGFEAHLEPLVAPVGGDQVGGGRHQIFDQAVGVVGGRGGFGEPAGLFRSG